MSFARRCTSEGILDDISEQTKPTGSPFVSYEEILICPFVLDYATLAINQYFSASTQPSQSRHARPKRTDFLREHQTHIRASAHIAQSPLNPPDRATTIALNPPDRATTISLNPPHRATTTSRLVTQSIARSRERC